MQHKSPTIYHTRAHGWLRWGQELLYISAIWWPEVAVDRTICLEKESLRGGGRAWVLAVKVNSNTIGYHLLASCSSQHDRAFALFKLATSTAFTSLLAPITEFGSLWCALQISKQLPVCDLWKSRLCAFTTSGLSLPKCSSWNLTLSSVNFSLLRVAFTTLFLGCALFQ